MGLLFGAGQRWQKKGGHDANDRDDDQKLDQSERKAPNGHPLEAAIFRTGADYIRAVIFRQGSPGVRVRSKNIASFGRDKNVRLC